MKIWYIRETEAGTVFHDKVFTTKRLAMAYLDHDTSLSYYGVKECWYDIRSNKVVAELKTADLCVD
jgi:hypothetical protein